MNFPYIIRNKIFYHYHPTPTFFNPFCRVLCVTTLTQRISLLLLHCRACTHLHFFLCFSPCTARSMASQLTSGTLPRRLRLLLIALL